MHGVLHDSTYLTAELYLAPLDGSPLEVTFPSRITPIAKQTLSGLINTAPSIDDTLFIINGDNAIGLILIL
jgi:hypothetical protein